MKYQYPSPASWSRLWLIPWSSPRTTSPWQTLQGATMTSEPMGSLSQSPPLWGRATKCGAEPGHAGMGTPIYHPRRDGGRGIKWPSLLHCFLDQSWYKPNVWELQGPWFGTIVWYVEWIPQSLEELASFGLQKHIITGPAYFTQPWLNITFL